MRTVQDTLALVLLIAAIMAVVGIVLILISREDEDHEPLFNNPNRPLPNILLGWIALWLIGAVVFWTYDFPTEARALARINPPGVEGELVREEALDGAPATGAELDAAQLMVTNGCGSCHTLDGVEGMTGVIGPALTNMGAVAEERIEAADYDGTAETAAGYIAESIIAPDVYIVDGYPAAMPANYEQILAPGVIETMVEFLATLE